MNQSTVYAPSAQMLRAQGVTYQGIADVLNISLSTAYRATNETLATPATSNVLSNPVSDSVSRAAILLREGGMTYKVIAELLNIAPSRAWRMCNLQAARANSRESSARYNQRGKVAIADLGPASVWFGMNRTVTEE
jgi:DNA invertase Pin-like site-specific DNA recombinase